MLELGGVRQKSRVVDMIKTHCIYKVQKRINMNMTFKSALGQIVTDYNDNSSVVMMCSQTLHM